MWSNKATLNYISRKSNNFAKIGHCKAPPAIDIVPFFCYLTENLLSSKFNYCMLWLCWWQANERWQTFELSLPPSSTLSLIPNGPLIFVRPFFLNKIKPNSIELSVIMRYLLNSVRCHIVKTCRFHMKNPFFGRYYSIYLYKLCYIWRIIPMAFLASKWKNGVKSWKKVTKWKILTKLFSSKKMK